MKKNTKIAAEVGAGIAVAAAAAAAGYYFYGSKDAKQHRKIAAKWATDMKKDVIKEAKKLKNVDAKTIGKVVDSAAAAYYGVQNIDRKDLARAAKELKANWELVRKEAGHAAKKLSSAKKTAKKVVSKAKKVTKKKK